jgi:hypothetical protein
MPHMGVYDGESGHLATPPRPGPDTEGCARLKGRPGIGSVASLSPRPTRCRPVAGTATWRHFERPPGAAWRSEHPGNVSSAPGLQFWRLPFKAPQSLDLPGATNLTWLREVVRLREADRGALSLSRTMQDFERVLWPCRRRFGLAFCVEVLKDLLSDLLGRCALCRSELVAIYGRSSSSAVCRPCNVGTSAPR